MRKITLMSAVVVLVVATLGAAGCRSGGSSGDGSGAAAGAGGGGEQAQGAQAEEQGPTGVYTGTLTKASPSGAGEAMSHEADVAPYRGGAYQLGVWEFCNLDLVGEAPAFTVADEARCLIDQGAGRQEYRASGTATIADGSLAFTVTFTDLDGHAVAGTWSFTGTWARRGMRSMPE